MLKVFITHSKLCVPNCAFPSTLGSNQHFPFHQRQLSVFLFKSMPAVTCIALAANILPEEQASQS